MPDPVHYALEPTESELLDNIKFTPGWYFWTETWADRIGPFETEAEAQAMAKKYGESL